MVFAPESGLVGNVSRMVDLSGEEYVCRVPDTRSRHTSTASPPVAALIAKKSACYVESCALVADHIARFDTDGDDPRAAIRGTSARCAGPFKSRICTPVADRIVHEFQLRHLAEIPERKHGRETTESTASRSLGSRSILQAALIRFIWTFNRLDLNRALDLAKSRRWTFPHMLIGSRLNYLILVGQCSGQMV